jgi:GNAT superfamily N-acetyltransferase
MNVQASSVSEIEAASNFDELLAEYANEATIARIPAPTPRMETYRHLESAGMLHVFSALSDGQLVGFITVLAPVLPHYGVAVAVSESFFVARAHRKTGAGLKLLSEAEAKAASLGSPGLLVSAPFGGDLFHVLPRVGYAETNRIFFKRVGDV